MSNEYILEMRNITKEFPGVLALNNVELKVKKGSVHAIMGENGAGKSTLMKVLTGNYIPDSGEIIFKGNPLKLKSPYDGILSGISMIHQELSNVKYLTVAENMFLGREILKGFGGVIDKKKITKECQKNLDKFELNINAKTPMSELSVAKQQMCEIAKAISNNADLIIMDEPTSAITESEVDHLFRMIENVKNRGATIIYITHKMDEVFKISDEISVYRDGCFIKSLQTSETTQEHLIELMVGRKLTTLYPKEQANIGEEVLKVENLSLENVFYDVSFNLKKGEILGVSGLMGAGRSEIMETIFGIRKKKSGKIYLKGQEIDIKNPRIAISKKIGFLTEDRKESGCFLPLSVGFNIYITTLNDFCNFNIVNRRKANKAAENQKDKLSIKTPSLEQTIENLSGGNQQKALVGRWLLTESDILIVDEPTRGIDVGTKSEIYKLLSSLAKSGKSIIMISSEMPELLGMSDRIIVVSEGRITGNVDAIDATQELLMKYAAGITA